MSEKNKKRLQLLFRLPGFKAYYRLRTGKAPLPVNITLSLLYSCNSRCATCNVYEKRVKNFTLEEYKKTFTSLGRAPYWFTLSGGEPFLRKDIADIAKAAYDICQPGIINIPTNGSLYKVIPERVEEIVAYARDTDIIINLSLDEIGEQHDALRGFPGNWERAMKTYEALRELRRYPNFTLGIHTVISKFNVQRFPQIYRELIKLEPDSYITEMAEERVELGTMGSDITPSAAAYSTAIDFLVAEMRRNNVQGVAKIAQSFRFEYYRLAKEYLARPRQVIPCYAGITSVQISPDGDVWPCCIRADSMGNLRQNGYDFKKIWNGPAAAEIRDSIRNQACACPLANAGYTNLLLNGSSLIKVAGHLL